MCTLEWVLDNCALWRGACIIMADEALLALCSGSHGGHPVTCCWFVGEQASKLFAHALLRGSCGQGCIGMVLTGIARSL